MSTTTEAEIRANLEILKALADAIQELGSVPSGHLYARVMGHMDLPTYNHIIDLLIRAGAIRRDSNHLLTWIHPEEKGE